MYIYAHTYIIIYIYIYMYIQKDTYMHMSIYAGSFCEYRFRRLPLCQGQLQAVQHALRCRVSLIQGPPGG